MDLKVSIVVLYVVVSCVVLGAPPAPNEFLQLQCTDTACTQCDEYVFPTNQCNIAQAGYHAMGACVNGAFQQSLWRDADCSGMPFSVTYLPLNTCLQSIEPQTYFENICDFLPMAASMARRNASRPVRIPA
eukprot:TRINITY_DN27429_c0_g1_i1.p1 TRINITY_DN27429_c0_g1~~TRINITY_DN27429_c0_g1_i1.p1  ORF type:complete len:143 (+),score=18.08 TRINITY_DN27429_c0_g1_i1:39-431(+)